MFITGYGAPVPTIFMVTHEYNHDIKNPHVCWHMGAPHNYGDICKNSSLELHCQAA